MVDKNSIFGGMITTQGAAKKTSCDALGIPWEPRYMLIGDANGTDPVPSPSQTKLVNQVYRAQINQLRVSPTDANVLIAEVVLPPDVGGWWVRELALEDKDGVFSAVANAPPSYKPVLAQGSGRNQVVRMHIITNGTSNIQLKIDPAVVLATRQYVDEAVNGLLPANKPAGTYTKVTVNDRGVFVSGSNPTTLAGYGITDTYTKDQVTAMIGQASALPVGSVIAFPMNKVAPGFLELDGSVKSAATYPDLATFLGGAFNKGDEGAGNFRLPESRGEFLRGWDHGRGVDAGRAIGSMQLDSLQGFRVESMRGKAGTSWGNDDGGAGDPAWGPPMGSVTQSTRPRNLTGAFVSDGVNGVPRVGSETRGRNLAVMWCIKAWNAPINQGNIDVAALEAEVARMRSLVITTTHKRLFVSTTGASAVVALKAEKLIIGSGVAAKAVTQVDLSVNMAAAGLGGLDSGVVAASSCYGIWVATNGANTAAIAALMPVLQGAITLGSPVITGLSSTASMRVGMQFSSVSFPWGVTIKSIDSASQITASQPALATVAADNLRFAFEPVLPVGYTAGRFSVFFTDSSPSKFPLAYTQWNRIIRLKPGAGTNVLTLPVLARGVQGNPVQPPTFVPVALGAYVPPTASVVTFTITGFIAGTSVIVAPNPGHYGVSSSPVCSSPLHISQGSTSGATHDSTTRDVLPERGYFYYASSANPSGIALAGFEDDI